MRGRGEDQAIARSGRGSVRERAARERRVLRAGLAASALIHVVALGVLGGLLQRPPPERAPARTPLIAQPPSGMRAVNITPAPDAPAEPVEQPTRPEPNREQVVVAVPAETAEMERIEADDLTAADRLAPRLIDPRLWRPVVILPRQPTFEDVKARVAAALELMSDSALAEAEARVRATDWTITDADGGKWGISPGKLHLGKLTLPLPIAYAEEWNPERGEWLELDLQADRALILESFEERVKAIRERRDRERRERRQQEGGGTVAGSGSGG